MYYQKLYVYTFLFFKCISFIYYFYLITRFKSVLTNEFVTFFSIFLIKILYLIFF